MQLTDLINFLPFVILIASILVVMIITAFYRSNTLTFLLTLISLSLCLIGIAVSFHCKTNHAGFLLAVDSFASYYMILLFVAAIITSILAYGYMQHRQIIKEEFYILLLVATFGSAAIVSSTNFASFFLGLEILSISLYTLIAYLKQSPVHIEAGIKYLVPAGVSAAFLLFGMALVYLSCGTMDFSKIVSCTKAGTNSNAPLFLTGLAMILVGIGFKLALVPFHFWIPDVYEGAPAPVTGFIAAVSKGMVFALLVRYFIPLNIHNIKSLFTALSIIAIVSMFFGNLLALRQNNIKRILAYSSIVHIGYLLVAFLASGTMAIVSVSFYLAAYFITTLGAFGVITVLSGKEKDLDDIEDYRGLVYQHPLLAAIFTAMLFSFAGIPLTAGFIGKFYILSAGVNSQLWLLAVILVINSVIGLFYYLRVIIALFSKPPQLQNSEISAFQAIASFQLSFTSGAILIFLMLLLLWLGICPASFISFIQAMVTKSLNIS